MPIRLAIFTLIGMTTSALAAQTPDLEGFQPLFDGQSLSGWVQKGGKAVFAAEGGTIVGRSVPNTPNSFLCTKKTYGDFVLTYEYQCHDELNSGVQIRSQCYDRDTTVERNGEKQTFPAGRVFGYQVEIDPDKPDRLWSAGIYDEGRRGWLYPGPAGGNPTAFSQQGKQTYHPGQWNHVRVECRGDHIRTWLNDVPRADFHDDLTREGFIALQVHGVGARDEPLSVRWRNLMIKE
jgi:hypothetical protein